MLTFLTNGTKEGRDVCIEVRLMFGNKCFYCLWRVFNVKQTVVFYGLVFSGKISGKAFVVLGKCFA